MAERDWVSNFQALAARRAQLLGVRGEFYDHRRSSDEERDWPLSWLRAISSSDDFTNQNWPWGLWFAFADAPVLHLEGLGSGEGFRLELAKNLPETTAPRPERTHIEDLSELPPFSAVVQTPLRTIFELAYAAGPPGSVGWDERSPSNPPVGIRLMFDRGEVWLLNIADEFEVRGWRPPYWASEDQYLELREWEYPAGDLGSPAGLGRCPAGERSPLGAT